ncbi:MAG: Rieske 2Fe-2S domain-containing protein [Ilumatobacteraceae bacterium]
MPDDATHDDAHDPAIDTTPEALPNALPDATPDGVVGAHRPISDAPPPPDPARAARAESRATAWFIVSAIASIALAIVYWRGGQAQAEGALLAVICFGIGFAAITWAKHAMPNDEVAEDRHSVASTEEEFDAFTTDLVEGAEHVGRRRLLMVSMASAVAAFGAALLFPLRSLGPRPGKNLKHTAYQGGGKRVVTADGQPVKAADLLADSVVTVWPEGHTNDGDSPTLLIRTRPDLNFKPRAGREDWTVDGIVAYSKLCTHVGCPVGLYQADSALLLCPCHQSTFDVLDGARPIFGPAARSLPQLPLAVNDAGEIIAVDDFDSPVGPGYWDRGR